MISDVRRSEVRAVRFTEFGTAVRIARILPVSDFPDSASSSPQQCIYTTKTFTSHKFSYLHLYRDEWNIIHLYSANLTTKVSQRGSVTNRKTPTLFDDYIPELTTC